MYSKMNIWAMILLIVIPLVSCDKQNESYAQPIHDTIYLDTHNTLLLKGEVDQDSTHKFLVDLHQMKNKQNVYLFLDTNGGSVEDGNKIVNEVQKYNISCIANRAYSMGFVILQACKHRYITPFGRIMQHQISYGIANEKAKVESYAKLIEQVETYLAEMQSSKIGIGIDEFRQKTYNDWWMFGENAVEYNCADTVVNVECSNQLFLSNYTVNRQLVDYVYSKCPLISNPLRKNKHRTESIFDYL